MSRKFCGCCSNDKLQQDDFRGNGCFGDFSKPYGSDQASKHVLGRTDVTLTSVPQNSHQHTAQRQYNTIQESDNHKCHESFVGAVPKINYSKMTSQGMVALVIHLHQCNQNVTRPNVNTIQQSDNH